MKLPRLGVLLLALILLGEGLVRMLGLADMPLREANPVTGYIPKASQSGRFLNKDWHINAMQMISTAEFSTENFEVLLAGDSIVFGGNPLAQQERIGEQLNRISDDYHVYAIADGSWGFKNSLNYLERHQQQIRDVETIIFILNHGDFSAPSSWRCESFHPTAAPLSHLYFVLRKYLLPVCMDVVPEAILVPDYELAEKLDGL